MEVNPVLTLFADLSQKKWDKPFFYCLLICEAILSLAIVRYVTYTEIDWEAYMQEVTMWQSGERDYEKIRGGTGPLVYPAGFLYVYGAFKWIAGGDGSDIRAVQHIFCVLYVVNLSLVFNIYTLAARSVLQRDQELSRDRHEEAKFVWTWRVGMMLLCMSKRIHSIFVLRLFNDGPAMLLFYVSTMFFMKSRWKLGCIFYSLAVSIKMNILLFAPGLLSLLLQANRSITDTIICLGICGIIQLALGAPFLLRFPKSYIRKAFEFDRVFIFKWTVNWKFLPEKIFTSNVMSVILLVLHVGTLFVFAKKFLKATKYQKKKGSKVFFLGQDLSPDYVVQTLFVSNLIGIAFARTLHYQFYSWYFHSVPFLLLSAKVPFFIMLIVMALIEYSFNTFPASPLSSVILQCAHLLLMIVSYHTDVECTFQKPFKQV